MPFLSNSDQDIKKMLDTIGVDSVEDLIANIPEDLRFKGELNIPADISEIELTGLIDKIGSKNTTGISFMGGGVYDHYIPAAVDAIISRSEFYTAYTPYQPEVSQGTLQSIYEFQSMICELTAMDVTNASMYEGGSALAEAMLMACNHTRRKEVLVAGTLNYRYKDLLNTYVSHNEIEIVEVPVSNYSLDLDALNQHLNDETAALIFQHPNYFGYLEEIFEIQDLLKDLQAMMIVLYDPVSLGLLTPPGMYGADIAVGEGQSLGNRQNFGGPFIGLFSTRQDLVRKIPGRLSGRTTDLDGTSGYVLTLQTREQHIRREKATSNICTNSGLLAMAATVYLALLGKYGIKEIGELCLQKSHYLADNLSRIDGIQIIKDKLFFKEFVYKTDKDSSEILAALSREGILGGINLSTQGYQNQILTSVTEKRTKSNMDDYISTVQKYIAG
jgi:glycine dehydrogenase subunit 1